MKNKTLLWIRNNKYESMAVGLCLLIFIVLLLLSHFHEIGGYGVETDFYGSYAVEAKRILQGKSYQEPDHGPGYSLVLSLFYLIFRDIFFAGKFVSMVSAVLLGYFTFKTIKILFNSRLAFFTIFLLFINILPYSILASNDVFFAFLIILAIYLIFRNQRISYTNLFWAGLVAGYAFMTRINAIILPAGIVIGLIFINPEHWKYSQRFKAIAIFSLSFLVTASPWLIMNIIKYGNPFATDVYQTVGAGMYGPSKINWAEQKNLTAKQYHSLVDVIFSNFKYTLIFFFKNVINHFQQFLINLIRFPAYLFLAPGALFLIKNVNRKQMLFLIFPVLGFLIYCLLVFTARFYLYILSFFILMVVYYLFEHDYKNEKSSFYLINRVIFITIIIFLMSYTIKDIKKNITTEPLELKKIAQNIKSEVKESDIMIARKPHLGFLSNMRVIYFPDMDTIEELLKYSRKNKATYLLYSDIEAELRPKLKILQQPEKVPNNLKLVYHQSKPEIVLYKIL